MLDIPYSAIPADIDESTKPDETPTAYVARLSVEKAQKVANDNPGAYVIGSDLTVDLNGRAIQKAGNPDEAYTMLKNFSGTTHQTHCGYAIIHNDEVLSCGVLSTVIGFKEITSEEIKEYVDSNEWRGLAGAYGVQGAAAKFVKSFSGSYFDILGLPIYEIAFALIKYGFPVDLAKIGEILQKDREKAKLLNSNAWS
jgi:septum formation protein